MVPPTSTWICGATCGDIPPRFLHGRNTRLVVSNSKANQAVFVRGSRSNHAVACIDHGHGSTDDAFSIWIDNTAADRPCGGILGSRISFSSRVRRPELTKWRKMRAGAWAVLRPGGLEEGDLGDPQMVIYPRTRNMECDDAHAGWVRWVRGGSISLQAHPRARSSHATKTCLTT